MKPILTSLFAVVGLLACATAQSKPWNAPQGAFAWVQYGSDGRAWVRAVASESECPKVELEVPGGEKRALPMSVRAKPTPEFPRATCELRLSDPVDSAARLSVAGVTLPLPAREPKRIVLLGDTGCRIKKGKDGQTLAQACNDPAAWPLARLAAEAARLKPDLVIHLGDYLYREVPCPKSEPGCEGSPAGDRWETWVVDFLEPA
jgi:hypothetical protein